MSEYTPITGELREYATVAWDPWPEARDRLYQMCDAIDSVHANLERENAALKAELDRVLGEQEDKALTYEEAKQLCMKAFDGGATYGTESMRFGVNARAYDWEHWLEKHESLFKPTDTWERIIEDARTCTGSAGNYTSVPSMRWTNEVDALVARCKALCERTKEDA